MSTPTPAPPHPELGNLIARRGTSTAAAVACVIIGMCGLGLVVSAVALKANLVPNSGARSYGASNGTDAMLLVGASIFVASMVMLWWARASSRFYELGAVWSRGKRVVTIPYAEADRFTFAVTRQYVNGIYAGTSLKFRLRAPDKRSISYSGTFKMKSRGFFKREFEIKDEMEVVKQVIAEQMAVAFVDRLLAGESIAWCKYLTMTAEGLTPMSGKTKGQLVPYRSVTGQSAKAGVIHLFAEGHEKSLPGLSISAENFWPCYFAFLQLAGMMQATEDESPAPVSGDAAP